MANLQAVPLPVLNTSIGDDGPGDQWVSDDWAGHDRAGRADRLVIEPTPELAVVLDELPDDPAEPPPEMAGMYYLG